MIDRRGFVTGLISLVAAPVIVRAGSLMPVKAMEPQGLLYQAISVEEMLERMMGGPAISAAFLDFMAFGSCVLQHGESGIRHVPLQEWCQ